MKIACVIPAKVESERVPGKNLRLFAGKPLVAHAVGLAREVCEVMPGVDGPYVYTASREVAKAARAAGAQLIHEPPGLARETRFNLVIMDMLVQLGLTEGWHRLLWWNTTAPLLRKRTAERFLARMRVSDADVLFTATEERAYWLDADGRPLFTYRDTRRTQDLPPLRRIVWALTGIRADTYLAREAVGMNGTFSGRLEVFEVPADESVDLDTETDWSAAERLWSDRSACRVQPPRGEGGRAAV